MNSYKKIKLSDFVYMNPSERLPKGTIARKISMDQIELYKKFVFSTNYEQYSGGAKFRNGDTIMARITPCLENGKTAFVSGLAENEIAFGSTEYIVLRAKENISIPDFVYYLTISSIIREPAIKSMVGSSGRQRVQQSVLDELEIPLFSIADQQHIVDILGSIDDKIENNEKKIKKLLEAGQLFYKNDIAKNQYDYAALSTMVKITRGASPRPIQNFLSSEGHPWIKISDVTALTTPFLFETKEYVTSDGAARSVAVFPDDLILSNSATPGIPVFVQMAAYVHDGWLVIREFKHITSNYLFWVLKNDRESILSQGNGSIFTNLKTDILKQHKIPVPHDERMKYLDRLYGNILSSIKALTTENSKLNELKQLYLKKFFG